MTGRSSGSRPGARAGPCPAGSLNMQLFRNIVRVPSRNFFTGRPPSVSCGLTTFALYPPGNISIYYMDPSLFSVLLIDDEPGLLEIFSHMAERSREVKMQTASSAKDALRLLQDQAYDAIIVDYEIPEINGIQFLKNPPLTGGTPPPSSSTRARGASTPRSRRSTAARTFT